jgi:hypothetical protein
MSERSPAPLRQATKKVRMISRLLIMVQDSIYRQPGLTVVFAGLVFAERRARASITTTYKLHQPRSYAYYARFCSKWRDLIQNYFLYVVLKLH